MHISFHPFAHYAAVHGWYGYAVWNILVFCWIDRM